MRLTTVGPSVVARVVHAQRAAVAGQSVGHLGVERAGVALLAVRADVAEPDADPRARRRRACGLPQLLVEALQASVDAGRRLVHRRAGRSCRRWSNVAVGDAVGEPADHRTEVGAALDVVRRAWASPRTTFADVAGAVGHLDGAQDRRRRSARRRPRRRRSSAGRPRPARPSGSVPNVPALGLRSVTRWPRRGRRAAAGRAAPRPCAAAASTTDSRVDVGVDGVRARTFNPDTIAAKALAARQVQAGDQAAPRRRTGGRRRHRRC